MLTRFSSDTDAMVSSSSSINDARESITPLNTPWRCRLKLSGIHYRFICFKIRLEAVSKGVERLNQAISASLFGGQAQHPYYRTFLPAPHLQSCKQGERQTTHRCGCT